MRVGEGVLGGVRWRVVVDLEALRNLESAWDALYHCSPDAEVFQSWSYCYHSWRLMLGMERANRLRVYVLSRSSGVDESLSAIVPLYADARGILRFINDVHADVADALLGNEPRYEVLRCAAELIASDPEADAVELANLPGRSALAAHLCLHVYRNRLLVGDVQTSALSVAPGKSFPDSLESLGAEKRRLHGKHLRNKCKDVAVRMLCRSDACFPADECRLLADSMVERGERNADYFGSGLLDLAGSLFEDGHLRVMLAERSGAPAAAALVLVNGERLVHWIDILGGRDGSRAMTNYDVLVLLLAELSGREGVRVNLGRGVSSFKAGNFNPAPRNAYRFFHSRSPTRFARLAGITIARNWLRPAYHEHVKAKLRAFGLVR